MAQFETRTSSEDGRVTVVLSGECDLAVREELIAVLLDAARSAPVVIVDLGGLTFMDSSGIHGLVAAHRSLRDDGGCLYAINATGVVAQVLDLTGVGELLRAPSDRSVQSDG
jgi:anti-anti-sigma factor